MCGLVAFYLEMFNLGLKDSIEILGQWLENLCE